MVERQTNLTGATSGSDRVYRGGSWNLGPQLCRVAYRNRSAPGYGASTMASVSPGRYLFRFFTFLPFKSGLE